MLGVRRSAWDRSCILGQGLIVYILLVKDAAQAENIMSACVRIIRCIGSRIDVDPSRLASPHHYYYLFLIHRYTCKSCEATGELCLLEYY